MADNDEDLSKTETSFLDAADEDIRELYLQSKNRDEAAHLRLHSMFPMVEAVTPGKSPLRLTDRDKQVFAALDLLKRWARKGGA